MKNLFLMYTLIQRPDGSLHLTLVKKIRLIYLALSVLLVVVLHRSLGATHPLMLGFYLLLPLLVVSEDRWIFDLPNGYLRRRFGLIFLAKTWHLPLVELAAIEYSQELAEAMNRQDPHQRIAGAVGSRDAGLRLSLTNGQSLTLYAASRKHYSTIKQQADQLASALNLPAQEV
jgi:hypothetical protein